MSYTPTNWQAGDTVTSAKLNKLEQGVAGAGVLVVGIDAETGALDKTWQEIHDAGFAVVKTDALDGTKIGYVSEIGQVVGEYWVMIGSNGNYVECITDSADGYPVTEAPDPGSDPYTPT